MKAVFGLRDIIWAVLICGLLLFAFDCRPASNARAFLEREAEEGFLRAYAGCRWAGNDMLITPSDSGGARARLLSARIQRRRLDIRGQRMSWTGDRAEFVVRQVIYLEDGTPFGEDVSQDIHLAIEGSGRRWRYTFFETREEGEIEFEDNPFFEALASR